MARKLLANTVIESYQVSVDAIGRSLPARAGAGDRVLGRGLLDRRIGGDIFATPGCVRTTVDENRHVIFPGINRERDMVIALAPLRRRAAHDLAQGDRSRRAST